MTDHGHSGDGHHCITNFAGWDREAGKPVTLHVDNAILDKTGVAGANNLYHYATELDCVLRFMGQNTDSAESVIGTQARAMQARLQLAFYLKTPCCSCSSTPHAPLHDQPPPPQRSIIRPNPHLDRYSLPMWMAFAMMIARPGGGVGDRSDIDNPLR